MWEAFIQALGQLSQPGNLLILTLGSLAGVILGALPGLFLAGLTIGMTFTFGWDPGSAMFLMAGMMGSVSEGGSVPAILLNIPGEAPNAATCFDGHPMARQGQAGRAAGLAAASSFLGAMIGLVFLMLLLPFVKKIVLAFGPPEFFMLVVFGLLTVAYAARGNMLKGLVSAGIGVLISLIGFSPVHGVLRFNLGSDNYLWDGIPLVPFFIGLFAIAELVNHILRGETIAAGGQRIKVGVFGAFAGLSEVFQYKATLFRSSAIGILAGLIPGIGGVLANFLSYSMAVQFSKHRERFGSGNPEGVIASEASNDAKDGGALLPTIIFGIPGSAGMAVLLGAFILHGLQPGFFFVREHMDIVFVLIIGLVISNFLASLMAMMGADILSRVTTLRIGYVVPVAFLLAIGGAYAARENVWDVGMAVLAGIFGFVLTRYGYSIVTLVIGFLLGVRAELSFVQSLQISAGTYAIFFTRPVTVVLMVLCLVILTLPALTRRSYRASA
ncbi:MAG: tripartite tricarboxylate transporter permease [Candidatus Binatia bacterium]